MDDGLVGFDSRWLLEGFGEASSGLVLLLLVAVLELVLELLVLANSLALGLLTVLLVLLLLLLLVVESALLFEVLVSFRALPSGIGSGEAVC